MAKGAHFAQKEKTKFTLGSELTKAALWAAMVLIPEACVLYKAAAVIWGLPYAVEVADTGVLLTAFIGAVFMRSRHNFQNHPGEINLEKEKDADQGLDG